MTDEDARCAARDTSVEGRLGDLENTVRNEMETTRRHWQAAERGQDVIDQRYMVAIAGLLTRVEALEAMRGQSDRMWNETVPALHARVSRIEDPDHSVVAERERQARWHATRDAAIAGTMAAYGRTGDIGSVDIVLRAAEQLADRAHGPLEAKSDGWWPQVLGGGKDELEAESTEAQLIELVKAARDNAESDYNDATAKPRLKAALKPFEGVL